MKSTVWKQETNPCSLAPSLTSGRGSSHSGSSYTSDWLSCVTQTGRMRKKQWAKGPISNKPRCCRASLFSAPQLKIWHAYLTCHDAYLTEAFTYRWLLVLLQLVASCFQWLLLLQMLSPALGPYGSSSVNNNTSNIEQTCVFLQYY